MRHLAAVMKGRGAEQVVAAYRKAHGAEGLAAIAETKQFQPVVKKIVLKSKQVLSDRFDVHDGVYMMTFFDLSRRKYHDLNNATFSTYMPETDDYKRLVLWTNPHNEKDSVIAPSFAGRVTVEKERAKLYAGCEVLTSEDGSGVERDVEVCAISMYSKYWPAMRKDIDTSRPAQLLLFFDVTGGFRSKPLNHIEFGSGDWAAGRALSQLALEPVAMNEFKEEMMYKTLKQLTAPSLDRLTLSGTLDICVTCEDPQADDINLTIPTKTRFCADQQGHKAASGQTMGNHSPWCKDCPDPNVLPKLGRVFEKPEQVFAWIAEIGCEYKDEKGMTLRRHMSFELLVGLPFKAFECPCGWKSGAERKFQKYVLDWSNLSAAEQKKRQQTHSEFEVDGNRVHWHMRLLVPGAFVSAHKRGWGLVRRSRFFSLHCDL